MSTDYSMDYTRLFMLPTTTQRAFNWLATYYWRDLSNLGMDSYIFTIEDLQMFIS